MTNSSGAIPFLRLEPLHDPIRGAIDAAIKRVIDRSQFICGEELKAFESEYARFCEAKHCVGVSNGLDALVLILRAMGIGAGDEVILPANSFIASALAVTAVNALPVLVDVDPDTYNIDVRKIEKAITPRTRAIMPVHLYGQIADMAPIMELAQARGIKVIEDAAQAHGARYRGRMAGSFGQASGFSFYPGKNLGAFGDGGAVVTQDSKIAARVESLRSYGSTVKYVHTEKGVNARLDELQAAILRVKLRGLAAYNVERRQIAETYLRLLQPTRLGLPKTLPESEHAWHLFVVKSKNRESDMKKLSEEGIQTLIHYPIPIHMQQAYADLGHKKGDFPVSEELAEQIISLPIWTGMDVERCARRIVKCLG